MVEEQEAVVVAPISAPPASAAISASGPRHTSKAPDSACSVGNSQSQRSGSSKSRTSNSSGSGSSGYGGHPSTLSSGNDGFSLPHSKDKDHRKKKSKGDPKLADVPSSATSPTAEEVLGTVSASYPHKKSDASVSATIGSINSPATTTPVAASTTELADEATPGSVAAAVEAGVVESEAMTAGLAVDTGTATAVVGVGCPERPSAKVHRVAFSQSPCCISNNNTGAVEDEELVTEKNKPKISSQYHKQSQPQQPTSSVKDEFTVVVSMQDGAVIYTSPSIIQALAFPRDMWVGKSFIDYVHSDDRLTLIQHITSGVALPRRQATSKGGTAKSPTQEQAPAQTALFCRLRRYPSLREGFAVADRGLLYRPFSLRLSFYDLPASGDAPAALSPGVLLTITATAVASAYKEADETLSGPYKFATRHQADGQLTHIDGEAVSLLGYLPQQLLGRPVFEIYHPADMRNLQRVYQQLVSRDCESPLKGQPYRLRAHNGCYIYVHTEWSRFINPWTRRLEFVIGQHHVLKGPSCPNVFLETQDEEMLPEELLQDSKAAQQEICCLLQQEVCRGETGTNRHDVSRRCKDLASFMETLIEEISKPNMHVDKAAADNQPGPPFSQRSSVTLGEISPHHDSYDSKSSSETPPSYNQLNYNDNIQRFFKSKPKTIPSDDSGDRLMALEPASRSTDEEVKPTAANTNCHAARKCLSPMNDTGSGSNSGSGSGSAGASANNGSVDTVDADGDYKPPHLTEALLCRHNEDMEKRMVQRHREQRNKNGEGKCNKNQYHGQQQPDKQQVEGTVPLPTSAQLVAAVAAAAAAAAAAHGTKRSGSHSWDGEPLKASKHSHGPSPPAAPPPAAPPPDKVQSPTAVPVSQSLGSTALPGPAAAKDMGLSLWPPFSVAVTTLHSPQPCTSQGNFCMVSCCGGGRSAAAPPLLPFYYLPAATSASAADGSSQPQQQQQNGTTSASAAFLQQQGGATSYVTAGMLYQAAAPLLYPLAPPPPPPPSHMFALQHQHPHLPAYQLVAAARGGVFASVSASGCQRGVSGHHQLQLQQQQQQPQLQQHQPLPRPASCATSVKVEPGSSAASVAASLVNRGASDVSQRCCRTSGEEETEAEDSGSGSGLRGQSSSSFSYSFLRSEGDSFQDASGGDASADATAMRREGMVWASMDNTSTDSMTKRRPILKDPPWLEDVEVTADLKFRYQMTEHELDKVLQDDLKRLQAISQSPLVNEQLSQLYVDMAQLDQQNGDDLHLDEGDSSSGSSSGSDSSGAEEITSDCHKRHWKRKNVEYNKIVLIYEENTPTPSPA